MVRIYDSASIAKHWSLPWLKVYCDAHSGISHGSTLIYNLSCMTLQILTRLIQWPAIRQTTFEQCEQQDNNTDCGVFVLAFAAQVCNVRVAADLPPINARNSYKWRMVLERWLEL